MCFATACGAAGMDRRVFLAAGGATLVGLAALEEATFGQNKATPPITPAAYRKLTARAAVCSKS